MEDAAPTTGEAADRAFQTGLVTVTLVTVGAVAYGVGSGTVSLPQAAAALLLGYPIVLLLASCVLGVWLGYDDEAKYKGAKYALEHTVPEDDRRNN